MLPVGGRDLVTVPVAVVHALAAPRAGEGGGGGSELMAGLRTAGHAGGAELALAFEDWVQRTGDPAPADLPLERFTELVEEFLGLAGWGRVAVGSRYDLVATIDVAGAWEARGRSAVGPACHVTTGLLAAFFSAFSPYPLAALEVECAAAGAPMCRILLGPASLLEEVYERMAVGEEYDSILTQISGIITSA